MGKVSRKELVEWEDEQDSLDDELLEDLIWWDKEQDNRMVKEDVKNLPNGVTIDPDYEKFIQENY